MARTPQAQALYSAASTEYKAQNNLPDAVNDWSPIQREAYSNYMAEFILANAQLFDATDQSNAMSTLGRDLSDRESYGGESMVSDFFGEFANQGEQINPFSEANRTKTALYIVGGVVALGAIIILSNKIK